MSTVDKKKNFFTGFILIILALAAALTVFYVTKVEPELKVREKARLAKLKAQGAKVQQRAADIKAAEQPKASVPSKTAAQPITKTAGLPKGTPPSPPTPAPPPKAESNSIDINKLVEHAKAVYGPEELNRKEGYLWIDRKANKFVVTLGALQGLSNGKTISIYDGDKKIGQVAVDESYDVISYGHPVDLTMDQFPGDYYRAVIE